MRTALLREVVPAERTAEGSRLPECAARHAPRRRPRQKADAEEPDPGYTLRPKDPLKGSACRSARRDTPHGGDPARGRRRRAGPGTHAPAERTAEGSRLPECAARHAPRRRPGKRPAPKSRTRDTRSGRKNRRRVPPAGVRGETRPTAETRQEAGAEEPDPGHTLRPKEPPKGPACRSARRDTPHGGDPGKRPAPKGRTRDALREGEVKPHMRRIMTTNDGDPRPEQARNLRQKIIIA